MLEVKNSENTARTSQTTDEIAETSESAETTENGVEQPRKVPAWAILIAVISFIIFNALFLVFAMQMGSSNPG